MSTLFTSHYLVQTTPKRIFRRFFLICAFIPAIGFFSTSSVRYNNSQFTKNQWLGALAGTALSAFPVLSIVFTNAEDLLAVRIIALFGYYIALTVYAIVSKKRDKGAPDVEIKTHTTWGGSQF